MANEITFRRPSSAEPDRLILNLNPRYFYCGLSATALPGGLLGIRTWPRPNSNLTFQHRATDDDGRGLLLFNRQGSKNAPEIETHTGALAGTVLQGGLLAQKIHESAINGIIGLGGMVGRQNHLSALNGVLGLGGMIGCQIHLTALDAEVALAGSLSVQRLYLCPLDAILNPNGLECRHIAAYGALDGIVNPDGLLGRNIDGLGTLAGQTLPSVACGWSFDINVNRVAFAMLPFRQAKAGKLETSKSLAQRLAAKNEAAGRVAWAVGSCLAADRDLGSTRATPLNNFSALDWTSGIRLDTASTLLTGTLASLDGGAPLDWRQAIRMDRKTGWMGQTAPPRQETARTFRFFKAENRSGLFSFRTGRGIPARTIRPMDWGKGRQPLLLPHVPPIPPPPPVPVYDNALVFRRRPWVRPGHIIFNFRPVYTVPIRRTYRMINSASLVLLPGLIPINCKRLQVSTDHGSWAWELTATLPFSELAKVTPDGDPIEVQATINGYVWKFILSRPGESREFGQRSVTLRGRSRSAWLDTPYALESTSVNLADYTAQQLAAQPLLYTGWEIDWQSVDWLVPAGAFSVERKTPIQAIAQLADACGAYLQSAPSAQIIEVLPEYPLLPWEWADATPDLILPWQAILKITNPDWDAGIPYNAVVVAGQTADGVAGLVKRDGYSGTIIAPQHINPLITHLDAARAKGGAILAKATPNALASIELPLGESGLIGLGKLIRIDDQAETWRGLTRSLSVSAEWGTGGLKVRQSIELERNYGYQAAV